MEHSEGTHICTKFEFCFGNCDFCFVQPQGPQAGSPHFEDTHLVFLWPAVLPVLKQGFTFTFT